MPVQLKEVVAKDEVIASKEELLIRANTKLKKYDDARQELIKTQLKRILAKEKLSENVYEIVFKSL